MSRAILIDNFLPQDTFDAISEKVTHSEHWVSGKLGDFVRDELWDEVTDLVFQRCKEIDLYNEHRFPLDKKNANFSHNQFRPHNYHHNNEQGPHADNGSYVFYIHPDWDEAWGGKLQIVNAEEEQYREGIFAKPNRFIWMNPRVLHDITRTGDTPHARATNLGFLNTCFDNDPVGVDYINISTTD